MNLRLIACALYALGSLSSLYADENIKGYTFLAKKTHLSSLPQAFTQKSNAAKESDPDQNCPPPPNPPPPTSIPVQNPNALPGAFYPNPNAQNILTAPPQAVHTTFVMGRAGMNPHFLGTPPDTNLAVGTTQVVLGDNSGVVSFDKEGLRQDVVDAQTESLLNLDGDYTMFISTLDNRIRFDHFTKRFFNIALNGDRSVFSTPLNNGVSLAISDSDVLSDSTKWTVLNIFDLSLIPDSNNCPGDQNTFFDFPSMAIDEKAVYITFNVFTQFNQSGTLLVIQKESLLHDGPAVITAFRDVYGFPTNFPGDGTMQAAMNFDEDPEFGYVMLDDPTQFGSMLFFRVIDPGSSSPSISPLLQLDVLQTGENFDIDTMILPSFPENPYGKIGALEYVGLRLQMAHVRDGQFYTTHATFVDSDGVGDPFGDRIASRWYQFDVTGDKKGRGKGNEHATTKPALIQAGTLFDSRETDHPIHYNFPAIMTNKRSDLTLCGTVSGDEQHIAAFFTGRLASDHLGSLRIGSIPPSVYATGSGTFTRGLNFGSPTGQRWGDMTYTDLDPTDDMTMWTLQEIAVDGVEVQVVAKLEAPNTKE